MEVLNVSFDEATELVTITFHPEKVLEAKQFFKELFKDDSQNEYYGSEHTTTCGMCQCYPCACGTTNDPAYDPTLYPQDGTVDQVDPTMDQPSEDWKSPADPA